MSTVELLVCIFLIVFLFLFSSVKIHRLIDFDFSYYLFETAVYSGLWKGNFIKNYNQKSCIVQKSTGSVRFESFSPEELKGLQVISFRSARSSTYYLKNSIEITIEPILFEVTNSKGR